MQIIKNLFTSNKSFDLPVSVDMHSHLLPGIDDGSPSIEKTLEMAQNLVNLGYKKAITTPHIIQDYYPNTPEIILPLKETVQKELNKANIPLELEAAAEYYIDEFFIEKVENKEPLLTMGDNYVLIETSFIHRPAVLENIIFLLKTNGYNPILAHPERYIYLQEDFDACKELKDRGVLLQLNIMSLTGHYSPRAKKLAQFLIDEKIVDFIGTDCHHNGHIEVLQKAKKSKYINKLADLNLLNNTL